PPAHHLVPTPGTAGRRASHDGGTWLCRRSETVVWNRRGQPGKQRPGDRLACRPFHHIVPCDDDVHWWGRPVNGPHLWRKRAWHARDSPHHRGGAGGNRQCKAVGDYIGWTGDHAGAGIELSAVHQT